MIRPDGTHKEHGKPRHRKEYRGAKRNNAISWKGVQVDRKEELPQLVKVISNSGEVSYRRQERV